MARILLVEDEPDVRSMLVDALTLRGHQVGAAASAAEALELAASENFEVAVIDYVLPGKRGLDLLQDLRKQQPFLRSIIVSGQIDHDVLDATELEKQLAERTAVDRYLAKPTSVDALHGAIEEVLQPAADGDWQQMAADAVAGQDIKSKDIKEMDRTLRKARRKRRK